MTDELRIYNYICGYKKRHDGNSPSVREIKDSCLVSSTSMVDFYLDKLEKSGLIKRTGRGLTRSIEVVGGEWRLIGKRPPSQSHVADGVNYQILDEG